MRRIILFLVFCSGSNGDISEKLRQGQGQRPNSQSNYPDLQPPFVSVKGGSNIKSTQISGIVLPHHGDDDENNLERLCNDPFHSFLCKPVGPRKYRIDGNLRPGAILPPGLTGSSSNLRENQQPLQSGSALLADSVPNGYNYPKPTNNVEILQKPGYSYPKPADNQLGLPSNLNPQGYNYQPPQNQLSFSTQKITTKVPIRPTYAPPLKPQNLLINIPLPSQIQPQIQNGYQYPKPSNQVPVSRPPIQNGYQYPKPSNQVPVSRPPVQNGYQYPKPSNQVLVSRPPVQNGYQYPKPSNQIPISTFPPRPPPTTTRRPNNEYLPPIGFQPQQSNTFNQVISTARPVTTPRPIITRPSTLRPFTTRPTPRPNNGYLPPFGYQPQQSNTFNQVVSTTIITTPRPTTTRPTTARPIITRPTPRPNNEYLPPIGNQPQQTNNFNQFVPASTARPIITTSRPVTRPTQRPTNEYLPPFGSQPQQSNNFNQVFNPPRPVITPIQRPNEYLPPFGSQPQQTNNFNQALPTERPNNAYLPPIDIRVDGQSTNLSPNIEGGSVLADEISPNGKKERTHTLEELCNDSFHSYLCKPITKPRKRIDGNIRPGAKIPAHVLQGAGSNQAGLTSPVNREGSALLPSSIGNQNGYQYVYPSSPFQSTNLNPQLLPYNPFFIASASDSSALAKVQATNQQSIATTVKPTTGYNYPKPTKNPLTYPTTGYVYTKPPPNRRFTLPSFATTLPTFGSRLAKEPQGQAQETLDDSLNTLNDSDDLPHASQFEILKP